jgi:hypothetical protein
VTSIIVETLEKTGFYRHLNVFYNLKRSKNNSSKKQFFLQNTGFTKSGYSDSVWSVVYSRLYFVRKAVEVGDPSSLEKMRDFKTSRYIDYLIKKKKSTIAARRM